MVHPVLSGPLHAPELGGPLEALIPEGTHLVRWSSKVSLSITAAIRVVPITATRVAPSAPTANPVLDLHATKATFGPPPEAPVVVPVPVATVAPRPPRIPITAIILEATSPPPSTTWGDTVASYG